MQLEIAPFWQQFCSTPSPGARMSAEPSRDPPTDLPQCSQPTQTFNAHGRNVWGSGRITLVRGAQILGWSRTHFKIPGARSATRSKFRTEDQPIFGATEQNSVARDLCANRSHALKFKSSCMRRSWDSPVTTTRHPKNYSSFPNKKTSDSSLLRNFHIGSAAFYLGAARSFIGDTAVGEWSWPIEFLYCPGYEWMALHLHSLIRLHDKHRTTLLFIHARNKSTETQRSHQFWMDNTRTQHLTHNKRHLGISLQTRCTPRLHCSVSSIRPHDSVLTKQNSLCFH